MDSGSNLMRKCAEHFRQYSVILLICAGFALALPSHLDWRSNNGNWLPPVKNQGGCSSAWAFCATTLAESRIKFAQGDTSLNPDLSEQYLMSCSDFPPPDCGGGNILAALYFMRSMGIPREGCFPYTALAQPCSSKCANWQDSLVKVPGVKSIYATDASSFIDSLKFMLGTIGPVGANMNVYSSFNAYTTGIIDRLYGTFAGGQPIVIVGYNDSGSYWICRNTWGTGWGEKGYFRINYGVSNFFLSLEAYAVTSTDYDNDSVNDGVDKCPLDPHKSRPGLCGCGTSDTGPGAVPLKVPLKSPDHRAIVQMDSVTLTWHKLADPICGYIVEIADDSVMGSVVERDTVRVDTLFAMTGLLDKNTYWWRVKAGNSNGPGPIGESRSFVVQIATTATHPDRATGITRIGAVRNGKIMVTLSENTEISMALFSLQGRMLMPAADRFYCRGSHEISIPQNRLMPGSYILHLTDHGQKSERIFVVPEETR
jgi:hypothetical protein